MKILVRYLIGQVCTRLKSVDDGVGQALFPCALYVGLISTQFFMDLGGSNVLWFRAFMC
jgi:hypothetical protein